MDNLTNDWPLIASGETTFELIDHYLLVLMEDRVYLCTAKKTAHTGTQPSFCQRDSK